MADIKKIISFIDQYLENNNVKYINSVDANSLLDKAGILNDSKTRAGKPLREILRKDLIPHAYQVGVHWFIPHSGTRGEESTEKEKSVSSTTTKKIEKISKPDLSEVTEQIKKARDKFKPSEVKCLFIAEAPPESIERFFYYEDVKKADYLFLGIVEVLYPELKEKYLSGGRQAEVKEQILEKLKDDGFYLLDLLDIPLGSFDGDLNQQAQRLATEIEKEYSKEIPIIIIKSNVFDSLFGKFKQLGFVNVYDEKIPFPGQGWQIEFREKFSRAIKIYK